MTKTKPTVHRPEVQAWIHELRSGRRDQGIGQLVHFRNVIGVPPANAKGAYCCLGVAEEARGCTWVSDANASRFVPVHNGVQSTSSNGGSVLSDETAAWLGLTLANPHVAIPGEFLGEPYVRMHTLELSMLNDSVKLSLFKIGDLIERQDPDWDGSLAFANEQIMRWHARTS